MATAGSPVDLEPPTPSGGSVRNRVLALVVFTALHCGAAAAQEAKNVILFIGDGLGASQTALALQFGRLVSGRETHMEALMRHGNSGYTLALPLGTPVATYELEQR